MGRIEYLLASTVLRLVGAVFGLLPLDRERIVRREVRKLWTQLAYVGAARTLLAELSEGFQPRPLSITGLAAHHYRGGPWETAFAARESMQATLPKS